MPSHLYSFSFAPNPDWTHAFSRQPEIWDYLRRCAAEFGLTRTCAWATRCAARTGTATAGTGVIDTSRGDVHRGRARRRRRPARPSRPIPELPGLETFAGAVFHSARWNHDYDLTGRRVAVIGTGASAQSSSCRGSRPDVARLHVFQRTAPWVIPRRDRPFSARERRRVRARTGARRLARAAVYWGREARRSASCTRW